MFTFHRQASSASSSGSTVSSAASSPLITPSEICFSRNDSPRSSLSDEPCEFILIVGGLGYIGSHTAWELLKEGYNVAIVDNLSNSYRGVFDQLEMLNAKHKHKGPVRPSLDFHEADYRDKSAMRALLDKYRKGNSGRESEANATSNIIGVIHFAAFKAVSESIQQPLKYYSNNVAGMVDFCSMLDEFGIKSFIFSSSAAVYGEIVPENGQIPENYCTHQTTLWIDVDGSERTTHGGCTAITNPYGRTKWMCEAILNDLATADPEWSIVALRYFNPIGCDASSMLGEDPKVAQGNLLPMVVKVMNGEIPFLRIYGTDWNTHDGSAIRDFIHVTDLARGHIAALSSVLGGRLRKGFHVYNLGTGRGQSVIEIVKAMETYSGQCIPTRAVGQRKGDVASCIANPSKAAVELNWWTTKTLADCCEDLCRYLRTWKAYR